MTSESNSNSFSKEALFLFGTDGLADLFIELLTIA